MRLHHFLETLFHRLIILSNNDITEHHLTQTSYIPIAKWKKINNPERHFFKLLFRWKSFSQIVVPLEVIFSNLSSAERHFPGSFFTRMLFSRKCIESNAILPKPSSSFILLRLCNCMAIYYRRHFISWLTLTWTKWCLNRLSWHTLWSIVSIFRLSYHATKGIIIKHEQYNIVEWLRWNGIQLNAFSGKWRSTQWKMTFQVWRSA